MSYYAEYYLVNKEIRCFGFVMRLTGRGYHAVWRIEPGWEECRPLQQFTHFEQGMAWMRENSELELTLEEKLGISI